MATACKIDFDEQADEWLKEVQPNAKKLAEHQRKKDRKDAEKALNEKKERIRKAKEAREAAAKEAAENPQVRLFFGILLLRSWSYAEMYIFVVRWCIAGL